jgi:hypothetical protein
MKIPARSLGLLLLLCAAAARAQSPTSPDADPEPPWRPPEGSVIITLPSADTNPSGSLQFLITHRFTEPVQDSDIHSFFSFFSPAKVSLGLSYTPVKGLEAGFLRAPDLEDYEVFAKYSVFAPADGPFHAAVRLGGDFRTARQLEDRSSFFAQAVLAFTIASRVRVSAVPTFSTRAVGPLQEARRNVFNVPFALTASITRSINVQAEAVPRFKGAQGMGWIAAVEKTLLRHRFAFTVGNIRATSVDQYINWQPDFFGQSAKDIYFGFNIVRLWKLK